MLQILCSPYPDSPDDEKMLITFMIKKNVSFFAEVECPLITVPTYSLNILSTPTTLIATLSCHTSGFASTKLLRATKDQLC